MGSDIPVASMASGSRRYFKTAQGGPPEELPGAESQDRPPLPAYVVRSSAVSGSSSEKVRSLSTTGSQPNSHLLCVAPVLHSMFRGPRTREASEQLPAKLRFFCYPP